MAPIPVSPFAASLIPSLEPIAGFSLALNLAYLNLKRWRYREEVRHVAKKALDDLALKQNDNGSAISQLPQLRGLNFLAGEAVDRKRLPRFITVFHILFGKEFDVASSVIFAVVAALLLGIGVAHNLGTLAFILPIAGRNWCLFYYWLLIASLVVPAGFVSIGRWLVGASQEYADECATDLASVYEQKISAPDEGGSGPMGGLLSPEILERLQAYRTRHGGGERGED